MSKDFAREANEPPYVLALTIVRSADVKSASALDDEEVLFCVRNRNANLTHPDVVSVPTQRIPGSVGAELEAAGTLIGVSGETQLLSSDVFSNRDTNGHNSMVYIVESLLSRKMGVADHLESDDLHFTVQLVGFHHGRARYPMGTGANNDIDDDEELKMLNLQVQIEKGAHLFPNATRSYGVQKWTAVSDFIEMWDKKDPIIVGLTPQEALGCCVDGLCIASTYDGLRAKRD